MPKKAVRDNLFTLNNSDWSAIEDAGIHGSISLGTGGTSKIAWRREGRDMLINWQIYCGTSGYSASGVSLWFDVPTGTIDYNALPELSSGALSMYVGWGVWNDSGTTGTPVWAWISSPNDGRLLIIKSGGSGLTNVLDNELVNNDYIVLQARVPMATWG